MENYICINVQVTDIEQEWLAYELSLLGAEGFEHLPNLLKVYFKKNDYSNLNLNDFLKNYTYQWEELYPENWNQIWENHFPMVVIDGICEIYASHHQPTFKQPYAIYIQPQMSFGTGHHATTQLMIQLMHEWNCDNKKILDIGAGTGILGIFSLLKNASNVTFIDIEEYAIENIKDNLSRNGLPQQIVIHGDHHAIHGYYDAILSNIQKNVLIEHAPKYANHLLTNGDLFLSGFLYSDEKEILESYAQYGFELLKRNELNDWVALHLKKL